MFVPPLTREDRRSLAFHEAIARRLVEDPDVLIIRARKNLARLMLQHPHVVLLKEWRRVLLGPIENVLEIMSDRRVSARELRAVSPFAGVLTGRERRDVLLALRRQEFKNES